MSRPDTEIAGITAGQAALEETLTTLGAHDLARPSLLPDWTVAHVLAHLARNADSVVRRLRGAIDDQVLEQYVGGAAGRAAGIAESAQLPADELIAYVRRSSAEVEQICREMPDEAWDRVCMAGGEQRPATAVAYSRWKEVEIHHVDMGLHYTSAQWPPALLERMLPELLETLPDRADPARLLAWAIGRAKAPALAPWG